MRHANFVPGRGPLTKPKLAVVGEAPGPMENAKKQPFIGPAGQALNTLLMEEVQIDPALVYVTNVVKYWPRDGNGKTRPPTTHEIKVSSPYLSAELAYVEPQFVALLGISAVQAIFPHLRNIYEVNGQLIKNLWVPVYHPAAMLYPSSSSRKKAILTGYQRLGFHLSRRRYDVH